MIPADANQLSVFNGDVIVWLNQFSQVSAGFNRFINYVSSSPLTGMRGKPCLSDRLRSNL